MIFNIIPKSVDFRNIEFNYMLNYHFYIFRWSEVDTKNVHSWRTELYSFQIGKHADRYGIRHLMTIWMHACIYIYEGAHG